METNKFATNDFLPELSRLNLECKFFHLFFFLHFLFDLMDLYILVLFWNIGVVVCYLAFDVRMDSFTEKQRHSESRSTKLIQAAEDANSCLVPLDQGLPIWRYIETPTYRKLRISLEYLER